MKNISRRNFLKGSAAMGILAAMGGAGTAIAEGSSAYTFADTVKWDAEYDVVVLGLGFAGMTAAVTAADAGAKVLIAEKMSEALAGGNSIASGQTFLVPAESAVETVKTYLYNCNLPNPIPDEYLTWLCNGFATQLPWIEYVADGVNYEAGYVGGGELKWGSIVV